MLYWGAVFVVAVAFLVKSAEWFTGGAEELGVFLGLPAYVVGVTIVAIGTSLPELTSSILAVVAGSPEIVLGNVVGSNITNIFLVLGFAAVIGARLAVTYEIIHVDLPMLVSSAAFLAVTVWDGQVTRIEGLVLCAGALVYLLYAATIARQRGRTHDQIEEAVEEEFQIERGKLDPMVWPRIAGGAVALYFSAQFTVQFDLLLERHAHSDEQNLEEEAAGRGQPYCVLTRSLQPVHLFRNPLPVEIIGKSPSLNVSQRKRDPVQISRVFIGLDFHNRSIGRCGGEDHGSLEPLRRDLSPLGSGGRGRERADERKHDPSGNTENPQDHQPRSLAGLPHDPPSASQSTRRRV